MAKTQILMKTRFTAEVQTIFKTGNLKTSKKLKTLVSQEPVPDHTKKLEVKFTTQASENRKNTQKSTFFE